MLLAHWLEVGDVGSHQTRYREAARQATLSLILPAIAPEANMMHGSLPAIL